MHFSVHLPWKSLRNKLKNKSIYLLTTATIVHFVSFHSSETSDSHRIRQLATVVFVSSACNPCISSMRSLLKSTCLLSLAAGGCSVNDYERNYGILNYIPKT